MALRTYTLFLTDLGMDVHSEIVVNNLRRVRTSDGVTGTNGHEQPVAGQFAVPAPEILS